MGDLPREAFGVRGACSRFPAAKTLVTAPASWTHSKRFARFGCGSDVVRLTRPDGYPLPIRWREGWGEREQNARSPEAKTLAAVFAILTSLSPSSSFPAHEYRSLHRRRLLHAIRHIGRRLQPVRPGYRAADAGHPR